MTSNSLPEAHNQQACGRGHTWLTDFISIKLIQPWIQTCPLHLHSHQKSKGILLYASETSQQQLTNIATNHSYTAENMTSDPRKKQMPGRESWDSDVLIGEVNRIHIRMFDGPVKIKDLILWAKKEGKLQRTTNSIQTHTNMCINLCSF